MPSAANTTWAYSCVRYAGIYYKEAYVFLSLHLPLESSGAELVHVCKVIWNTIINYGNYS